MDNDLLSKSKLIDWLEEKIESYFLAYHNSHSDYDQGREASYHEVIESVRSGLFDPDPTPSPTIKPGDEDYITAYIINTTEGMFFNTTGVYGHFNWEYLSDFIKKHQDNDGPYELTKIAKRYPGKEIHFKFGLRYVKTEYQYNDTDSPPFVIPGYYLPTNIIVTEIL